MYYNAWLLAIVLFSYPIEQEGKKEYILVSLLSQVMLVEVRVNEGPLVANENAPRYGRSAKLLLPFTVKNANEGFVQNMFVYMPFQSKRPLKLQVKNLY